MTTIRSEQLYIHLFSHFCIQKGAFLLACDVNTGVFSNKGNCYFSLEPAWMFLLQRHTHTAASPSTTHVFTHTLSERVINMLLVIVKALPVSWPFKRRQLTFPFLSIPFRSREHLQCQRVTYSMMMYGVL